MYGATESNAKGLRLQSLSASESGAEGEVQEGTSVQDDSSSAEQTNASECGEANSSTEAFDASQLPRDAFHTGPGDSRPNWAKELNPWPDIEWDPFLGCRPISAGCRNCYAARRIYAMDPNHPSVKLSRVRNVPVFTGLTFFDRKVLERPLLDKIPATIFAGAHSDFFQPNISRSHLDDVFAVMEEANWHEFNVLTKYPERAGLYFKLRNKPLPPNVRLGVSAENQALLEVRWRLLKKIEAAKYILSLQPLLQAMSLPESLRDTRTWVVAMREVGPEAAPAQPLWFRSLRDQCQQLNVPFYWETTGQDGKDLALERVMEFEAGRPYMVNRSRVELTVIR